MRAVAETNVGAKRTVNQDYYISDTDHGIFIVADGLGGYSHGEIASKFASEALYLQMLSLSREDFEVRIESIVRSVNHSLVDHANSEYGGAKMGTTLLALKLFDREIGVVNVGDSTLFGYTPGKIELISHSHSLVSELHLSKAQARNHSKSHIVTSALGDGFLEAIDSSIHPISHDFYLLSSDGLTRKAYDRQIVEILENTSFDMTASRLIELALKVDGSDNITVVVVDPK